MLIHRAAALEQFPASRRMLEAIPEIEEGPYALEGAVDALSQGDPHLAAFTAVERLVKPDRKLAVLETVEEPMVAAIVQSDLPTWTKVFAATAALQEAGALLHGACGALRYCRDDSQRDLLSQVALDLAGEHWGDNPGVTKFLGQLESKLESLPAGQRTEAKVTAFLQLSMMEEDGLLGLAAASDPTPGTLVQRDRTVVVGGVRLPTRLSPG